MTSSPGEVSGIFKPIRVSLLDDHEVMREALVEMLVKAGLVVTASVGRPEQFLPLLEAEAPDVALVDLLFDAPGREGVGDGLGVLDELRRRHPRVRCLVFSVSADPGDVSAARRCGAAGYLTKFGTSPTALVEAVRAVAGGGGTFPAASAPSGPRAALARLTAREREVLGLVAQGFDNLKISALLDITEHTVKAHMAAIYRKLGAENRVELMLLARKTGGPDGQV